MILETRVCKVCVFRHPFQWPSRRALLRTYPIARICRAPEPRRALISRVGGRTLSNILRRGYARCAFVVVIKKGL
jgi:hypothetical protein